ncbi:NAD(P)/FAD-dependent oxidoreductase [Pseudomonas sp. Z18(2022)]|uniref:NAD(P)/FAD-dependent oxidoreductase n=1 Tax=Pseudomonas sp. Z18(2022) TaxID=2983410 RepID=UPI002E816484|nr:FAD-dependent oxidoreductase [Pseudomonas sp. Z18(2022)]
MDKKSVLVIGGGAAGHQIAYQLRDIADTTLVDPKTYWEVPMAVPRLLVEPDALAARIPYASFIGSAQHLQGRVTALNDASAKVALADGSQQTLSFDYAVIATGSASLDPIIKAQAPTELQRAAELLALNKRLRTARAVVVVGAGPVGVETAAELRESLPNVEVTLVHGEGRVLDKAPSKFAGWAEKYLRIKGVNLVLGETVTTPSVSKQPGDGKVITSTGRILPADAIIWAAGIRPATAFVADSWPDAVQANGLVKVDSYLRVASHPTVFAVGDVTNLPENRLAIVAGLHVKSVVGNLKRLIAAETPSQTKLKPYKPALPGKGSGKLMIVSLGRTDGLTSVPFGQFRISFLARKIKSHDLLVGMSRKALDLR